MTEIHSTVEGSRTNGDLTHSVDSMDINETAKHALQDGGSISSTEQLMTSSKVHSGIEEPASIKKTNGDAHKLRNNETPNDEPIPLAKSTNKTIEDVEQLTPPAAPLEMDLQEKNNTTSPDKDNQSGKPKSPKREDGTGKPVSPKRDDAGERLYSVGMQMKEKLELRRTQIAEGCTFKPLVNKPRKNQNDSKGTKEKEVDRFTLLHEKSKESARKKEELTKAITEEQCSFKPQISNKAKKLASKNKIKNGPDRIEELYKHAADLATKRKEKLEMHKKSVLEDCTFQPKILKNKTNSTIKQKKSPLYDAEREKQKRLELELKKEQVELSNCTFKPQVKTDKRTTNSCDSNVGKNDKKNDFFDRLHESGEKKKEKINKLRAEQEQKLLEESTFKPQISMFNSLKSKTSATKNGNGNSQKQPVHERLYTNKKDVIKAREIKKQELEKRFSFKPRISAPTSDRHERQGSIFERLHEENKKKKETIETNEQIKQKRELEKCTFRPTIAALSTDGNKDSGIKNDSNNNSNVPIWERLSSIDKKQTIEERMKQKEMEELKECTFKPSIQMPPEFGPASSSPYCKQSIFDRLSTGSGTTSAPHSTGSMNAKSQACRKSFTDKTETMKSKADEHENVKRKLNFEDSIHDLHTLELQNSKELELKLNLGIDHTEVQPASATNTNNPVFEQSEQIDKADGAMGKLFDLAGTNKENDNLIEITDTDQSKDILENYDTWAASLEEKMKGLK